MIFVTYRFVLSDQNIFESSNQISKFQISNLGEIIFVIISILYKRYSRINSYS